MLLPVPKGCIPLTVVTGLLTDVSPYLDFHFWQEVFVEVPWGGEQLARWCGPSHKQGDFLTYFVLLEDIKHLVSRSNVCLAKDPLFPNHIQRLTPPNGDTKVPIGKTQCILSYQLFSLDAWLEDLEVIRLFSTS